MTDARGVCVSVTMKLSHIPVFVQNNKYQLKSNPTNEVAHQHRSAAEGVRAAQRTLLDQAIVCPVDLACNADRPSPRYAVSSGHREGCQVWIFLVSVNKRILFLKHLRRCLKVNRLFIYVETDQGIAQLQASQLCRVPLALTRSKQIELVEQFYIKDQVTQNSPKLGA